MFNVINSNTRFAWKFFAKYTQSKQWRHYNDAIWRHSGTCTVNFEQYIQWTTKFITTFSASNLNIYFFSRWHEAWAWPASYSWICVTYVPILLALIRPVFCIAAIVEPNWNKVCKKKKTLPFWTAGSRFQRATPVLPFIAEISRFEMVLAWMSDIYEFFKSITPFINWM